MWDWLTGSVVGIAVIIILVCGVGVGIYLWYTSFASPIEDAKRDVVKKSHRYVEANRSRILNFVKEYNDISSEILKYEAAGGDYAKVIGQLKGQRSTIVDQLVEAVGRLQKDQVPVGATKVLEKEGRIEDAVE